MALRTRRPPETPKEKTAREKADDWLAEIDDVLAETEPRDER